MIQKLDISDNNLEDEGTIYISVALKSCSYLETLVNKFVNSNINNSSLPSITVFSFSIYKSDNK